MPPLARAAIRLTEENSMQTLQADYFAAYRNLKLSRDDKGVLVAEFHSDGGPFIMNGKLTRSLSMPFTESDKTERTRLSSLRARAGISLGT
jgi:hypothetical protein